MIERKKSVEERSFSVAGCDSKVQRVEKLIRRNFKKFLSLFSFLKTWYQLFVEFSSYTSIHGKSIQF